MLRVKTEIKLDWSEMDLFGHINNVAYFKYIQTARVNFLDQAGVNTSNPESKLSFAVAQSTCDFKKPLYYPGNLEVKSSTGWLKNTSLQILHEIYSNNELCAVATDVIVMFDYAILSKATIPLDVRKKLEG